MIDKTLRKATAERHGPVVVVCYTGGGDCLWLNILTVTHWMPMPKMPKDE